MCTTTTGGGAWTEGEIDRGPVERSSGRDDARDGENYVVFGNSVKSRSVAVFDVAVWCAFCTAMFPCINTARSTSPRRRAGVRPTARPEREGVCAAAPDPRTRPMDATRADASRSLHCILVTASFSFGSLNGPLHGRAVSFSNDRDGASKIHDAAFGLHPPWHPRYPFVRSWSSL